MANLNMYDPTQKPSLHMDIDPFDDPIREAGADATANFDNSDSDPTRWAGSESLGNDSDLADIQVSLDDEEDEADEEDLDVDDEDEEVEDDDDGLIHVNGVGNKH